MGKEISIFLDSGAFSAFTKGISINIQDYIKFIKDNREGITLYANLDVIGDAEGTWRNQQIMEEAGLIPLPCFHLGEEWLYLERYVKEYDYIALGGVAQAKNKDSLMSWLDKCWEIICDKDGWPKTRVHGFAVTSLGIMFRYPWFSVDSTSWVLTGRFGSIYVPRYRDGEYIYDESSWKIAVSNQAPSQEGEGRHFSTLSRIEQKIILDYIHSKGHTMGKSSFRIVEKDYKPDPEKGERWYNKEDAEILRGFIDLSGVFVDPERLTQGKDPLGRPKIEIVEEPGISNDYKRRDAMNIMYFLDLEKNMPAYPWQWRKKGVRGLLR